MGVLDKIKNALFEVEYVEVEEPPEKEKKPKKVREEKENKPIAKKIVLPGRRREKVEELEEEELRDEDFEIEPKEEKEEEKHEDFKVLDDSDFEMDDDEYIPGEPEILQVMDPEEENKAIEEVIQEENPPVEEEPVYYSAPEREERYDDYTSYEPKAKTSKPYGMDDSYNVPVHEYGRYEKYEEKTYFRPSPIISPIYGILDKNYKKEDVREKQDIRLTSYSRSSVNVDDIREKAYGPKHEEKEDVETTFEVEDENENLMVDLSDRAKPEVKEVTVGDALEYFEDLGLEYNVDYVDRSKEEQPLEEEQPQVKENDIPKQKEEVKEKTQDIEEDVDDDNDNLFDLIDSMYQENK